MEQITDTHTMYFYKGSTFPVLIGGNTISACTKTANDMIIMGLRCGISINEQIKDYTSQLDTIEGLLFKYCNRNAKGIKKVCKELKKTDDELQALWSLNICALLKLKVIENDNMNGYCLVSNNLSKKPSQVELCDITTTISCADPKLQELINTIIF